MEFNSEQQKLEYWFTIGMSKGYSFMEAVQYAEEQLNEN
jgi:hypothetical protein